MMQIREVLKEFNERFEVVSAVRKDLLRKEALKRIEENITITSENKYQLWSEKRRQSICRLGEISREWSRSIEKINLLKLAIIDDPIYFVPLFEKLKHLNVPIIGICHNLETLVSSQVVKNTNQFLFTKEIDLLSRCDLVITISREETFLLKNLGIRTVFFPYYPVTPILNRLLQVREKRKSTRKKGILLLGNAGNLQTRKGMEKIISFWQSTGLFKKEGKLVVAGYNTEKKIKIDYSINTIEFLGTLSNDRLDSLLGTVRACLCYQEQGAGALTRICEMLIAGVPVLANSDAARSYYNKKGVVEFPYLNVFEGAMDQVDEFDGQIPVPPEPDSSYLTFEIKKIISK